MRWKTLTRVLIIAPILLLLISATAYAFLPQGGSVQTGIAESSQLSSWSNGGGGGAAYLRLSSLYSLNGLASIEFGAAFNRTFSAARGVLSLTQSQNLSSEEYLLFWAYATPDLSTNAQSFADRFNPPFQFSVTLIDQAGSSKTYGNYPTRWSGWAHFAIPLRFQGLLSGQDPTKIVYNGVSETPNWVDDQSLQKISQIRFDLIANATQADNKAHSLFLTGLEFSHHRFLWYEGVNSVISAVAVLFSAILLPAYMIKYVSFGPYSRIATPLRAFFGEFHFTRRQAWLATTIITIKIAVATLTPLSSDFQDLVQTSVPLQLVANPLSNSPLYGGYMAALENLMYRLWTLLPIDHIEPLQMFPGNFFFPFIGRGIFNFPVSPGSMLLVLLLKLPLIGADIVAAVLIYKIVLLISGSRQASSAASLFWLVNPISTIIIEMWSNFDMLFLILLLSSVYLLIRDKRNWSAALLGLAVGVRLFLLVLLPFVVSVVGRDSPRSREGALDRGKVYSFTLLAATFSLISVTPFIASNILRGSGLPRIGVPGDPDISYFLGLTLPLYDYVILVLVGLMVAFLFVLYDLWRPLAKELPTVLLMFFLIFFAFTRWLPQWFLWMMPFLAIDFALNRRRAPYQAALIATIFPLIIIVNGYYFSSWGNSFFFFPPLSPGLSVLSRYLFFLTYDSLVVNLKLVPLLQSAFFGICIAYLVRVISSRKLV